MGFTVWAHRNDLQAFEEKLEDWGYLRSDDYYKFYIAIMINEVLNLAMTLFAIYMLEKMSQAEWSMENRDSKEARKTT